MDVVDAFEGEFQAADGFVIDARVGFIGSEEAGDDCEGNNVGVAAVFEFDDLELLAVCYNGPGEMGFRSVRMKQLDRAVDHFGFACQGVEEPRLEFDGIQLDLDGQRSMMRMAASCASMVPWGESDQKKSIASSQSVVKLIAF